MSRQPATMRRVGDSGFSRRASMRCATILWHRFFCMVGCRAAQAFSVDSKFALRAFAERDGYEFPLLADFWPHGEVARAY